MTIESAAALCGQGEPEMIDPIHGVPAETIARAREAYAGWAAITYSPDEAREAIAHWPQDPGCMRVTIDWLAMWDMVLEDNPDNARLLPSWYVPRPG